MESPIITRRTLTVRWNDMDANYEYWCVFYYTDDTDVERAYKTTRGDREWADRMANHYNLTLPNQPEDNNDIQE